MNILALDLSLVATGVAHGETLETWKPKTKGVERLAWYRDTLADLVAGRGYDMAVIEELPSGLRNQAGAVLGTLHGVIRVCLYDHAIPFATVMPAALKKYATGSGIAPKPDMRMQLYKRAGIDVTDDNQVDAWWLLAMALDHYGQPPIVVPAEHRLGLGKVDWPEQVATQ